MRNPILARSALVTVFTLFISSTALARDRPGIPTSLSIKQDSAGAVTLTLRNTAREVRISFEYEMWIDGVRLDPAIESKVSQGSGGYLGKDTRYSLRVSREEHGVPLAPDKEFCFRAWSRTSHEQRTFYDPNQVRSERPSGTACLLLKPDKPLAPTTVRAYFPNPSVTDRRIFVAWEMPPFEFNQPVDRFTIEREKWSGGSYVVVATSKEPRIEQSPGASSFVEQIAPPEQEGDYLFKVCAHNSAGSQCTHTSTSLVHKSPDIQGEREPRPELAAAGPKPLSTRLFTAGATQPQSTARAANAASATIAGTETMVCRGGPLMGWSNTPETADSRSLLSLIFQPNLQGPAANGDGLKPSECGIVGRGGYYPPNVRFEGGADIKQRLASSDQYWSFNVLQKGGYFEAVANAAISGPPVAIAPTQQIQGESTMPRPRIAPR